MTVTKRLKLKLLLLMLSSCSFAQHVPMTEMSTQPVEPVIQEEKVKSGEHAFVTQNISTGMEYRSLMAQASGGSINLEEELSDAQEAEEDTSLQDRLEEGTRYWKHEQRSTAM
jgi:hypothetical protein